MRPATYPVLLFLATSERSTHYLRIEVACGFGLVAQQWLFLHP